MSNLISFEAYVLTEFDAVSLGNRFPTFRDNMVVSSFKGLNVQEECPLRYLESS